MTDKPLNIDIEKIHQDVFNSFGFTDGWYEKEKTKMKDQQTMMVTGGCGFMGSHFVHKMVKESPYRIIVIDKLTYAGTVKNIEGLVDNIKCYFYNRDINDRDISSLMDYFDVQCVVNFAAESHVDRSVRNPRTFLETDIMGLFNMVWCSKNQGVKRFLHISTDEVYGDGEGRADIKETEKLNPSSPYSASKAAADLMLLAYHRTYNFPVIIARPCNNFGPNQYPEKLIPMAVTRLMNGNKVLLHGEGAESREWIWVGDCIECLADIFEKGKTGQIYNVGSGYRLTNKEVVGQTLKLMGKDWSSVEHIQNRPGNDKQYVIDSGKLKNLLGNYFDCTENAFKTHLKQTVQWYKKHPGWWQTIDMKANIY